MTHEPFEDRTFVVINVDRDDEQVRQISGILEPIGIPFDLVGRGRQLRRTPTLVLRVPQDRVAEVILALELRGFADVLAYELDDNASAH